MAGNLVFTRRVGEKVVVRYGNEDLIIEIVEIGRSQTKLSLNGPRSFIVDRQEVRIAKDANPREVLKVS